ncbi:MULTISPECIES: ribosome biogenesis GTP-binding protein YihA/YsxC [unclassified Ruminococcus]|uniref:ribosome biogenesis GTP-binding protein YihA/YsxC n=1 Tax=unclassified Ruminococcus TaxID=2608920 RepID=UPI00210C1CDB|nr:YihA family ribosome biogenesis GTP-binding protein [Ruminococcus sp. zg-924]MCQ4115108.1 YihA family ribosome biogenesis GTP-binding protein [Ruminococcus sp. zg-921]
MNLNNSVFEAAYGTSKQLPPSELPEIIFSGRSNVGKSSLINKLLNRKALARVSATPGKTATINFFDIDKKAKFVDLPGYGYAKVSQSEKQRWADLVEGYFAGERKFCVVVQIIDMRHKPTADDMNMLDFLSHNRLPFIVVLTKRDKLNKTEQQKQTELFGEIFSDFGSVPVFPFSALKGDGKEEILQYLQEKIEEYI